MPSTAPWLLSLLGPDTGADARPGTGCLVAADLVLTAAAPVPAPAAEVRVGLGVPGRTPPDTYQARIIARAEDADTGVSLALVRIEDGQWAPPADFLPPRLGTFTGSREWTQAHLAGGDVSVEVHPLARRRAYRWDLRPAGADRPLPADPALAGAPLVVADLIIGVALPTPRGGTAAPDGPGDAAPDGPGDAAPEGPGDAAPEAAAWSAVPVAALSACAGFVDILREHGASTRLDPVELAGMLAPDRPAAPPVTAVDLLDPARALTPHVGRAGPLSRLADWCGGGASLAGLLVTGAAGQGKSRLARELSERMYAEGWLVGEIGVENSTATWNAHVAHADRPVLLIADRADEERAAVRNLAEFLAAHGTRHPVRLLLLARDAGTWWHDWLAGLAGSRSAFDPTPLALPPLAEDEAAALAEAFRGAAVEALSRLPTVTPAREDLPDEADRESTMDEESTMDSESTMDGESTMDNDGPERDSPLGVHLAVLDELLAPAVGRRPEHARPGWAVLLDAAARWGRAAAAHGTEAEAHWRSAAALAMVCRPRTRDGALEVLRPLHATADGCAAADSWLSDMLPPRERGLRHWGEPLPGPLRDRWVADACGTPEFGVAVGRLSGPDLVAALAGLCAAATAGAAPEALLARLVGDRPEIAPAALTAAAAVRPDEPLLRPVREVLGRDDLPAEVYADVARAVRGRGPWDIAVRIHERRAAILRAERDGGQRQCETELAAELVDLAAAHAGLGDHAAALAAATEAVDIHRDVRRRAGAAAVATGMRAALWWVSHCRSRLGEAAGAIGAARAAVDLFDELATGANEYDAPLAHELVRLAELSTEAGRAEEAATAWGRAALHCDRLAASTGEYLALAAHAYCGLSDAYAETGQGVPAVEAIRVAVERYEALAEHDSPEHLATLASALLVLSRREAGIGDAGGALESARRAVAVYRRLAEDSATTAQVPLAEALRELADRYAGADNPQRALATWYECAERLRGTAAGSARASALFEMALMHGRLGQLDLAKAAAHEALRLYRAAGDGNAHEPRGQLVAVLCALSALYAEDGRPGEGERFAREALEQAERMGDPAAAAAAHHDLAMILTEPADHRPPRPVEATDHARQAVRLLEDAEVPRGHRVRALLTLSACLGALDRQEEAIDAARDAVNSTVDGAWAGTDEDLPAAALRALAERHAVAGQAGPAGSIAQRAIEAYQALADRRAGAYRKDLAYVCALRAQMGGGPDDEPEVLAAAREAVEQYDELRARDVRYQPLFVAALDLLADRQAPRYPGEATGTLRRAVEAGGTLMAEHPVRYRCGQVRRLRRLAELDHLLERPAAVDVARHAFRLAEGLGTTPADRGEYAATALSLVRLLGDGRDTEKERQALAQVAVYTYDALIGLSRSEPERDRYRAAQAEALVYRARSLERTNRGRARQDHTDAIAAYRALAQRDPVHRPALADALLAYARYAAAQGLGGTRFDPFREAVEEYRALAREGDVPRHRLALARALLALADELSGRAYRTEGLRYRHEAAELLYHLAVLDASHRREAVGVHQDLVAHLGTDNEVAVRAVRQRLRELLKGTSPAEAQAADPVAEPAYRSVQE